MVRITQGSSAAGALRYFIEELGHDELGVDKDVELGRWWGKGAVRLGLSGPVKAEQFASLLGNIDPQSGQSLSSISSPDRRPGVHVTFDSSKSLSVVAHLVPVPELRTVVMEAVKETLAEAEKRAAARVRKDGEDSSRLTGELCVALFQHVTTRPVDGRPDPQEHVHAWVFNQTYDGKEEMWKALEAGGMWEDAPLLQAVFDSAVIRGVRGLGFEIVFNDLGWEIAGVPQSVVEKFSRRSEAIEREAESRGIQDPEEKAELGAKTREPKSRAQAYSAMRAEWASRLTPAELAALIAALPREGKAEQAKQEHSEERARGREQTFTETKHASTLTDELRTKLDKALKFEVERTFERSSSVPERFLLEPGFKVAPGQVKMDDIRESLERHGVLTRIIDGRAYCTTKEALREERELVQVVVAGKGKFKARSTDAMGPLKRLSSEQRAAVEEVLTSPDLVTVVQGRSGVGKTTLTMAAKMEIVDRISCSVCMLAPTTKVAREVLRAEGHKSADTVARFFVDEKLQERARKGVIWVDEAGMLGTKEVKKLLDLATHLKARVVLMLDNEQHRSVSRGGWFDVFARFADVRTATVEGVKRQTGAYKEVVEHLNRQDWLGAFDRLEAMKAIHVSSRDQVTKLAAADYLAARKRGEKVAVVAETHRQIAETTNHIRAGMRDAGELKADQKVDRLQSRQLTEAERKQTDSYRAGDVVEFHRSVKRLDRSVFEARSRWEVVGHDPVGNVLVRSGITIRALPIRDASAFEVFERGKQEIAPGDLIRVTRNAKVSTQLDKVLAPFVKSLREPSHEVRNGQVFTVARVGLTGSIITTKGHIFPKSFGHITHAYCETSHSIQGSTVGRVVVLMTSDSGGASNVRHFNVGVARGANSVGLYTDSTEHIREVLKSDERERSATAVVNEGVDRAQAAATEKARRVQEAAMHERAREAEARRQEQERAKARTL